jgi:hypothetical protein
MQPEQVCQRLPVYIQYHKRRGSFIPKQHFLPDRINQFWS